VCLDSVEDGVLPARMSFQNSLNFRDPGRESSFLKNLGAFSLRFFQLRDNASVLVSLRNGRYDWYVKNLGRLSKSFGVVNDVWQSGLLHAHSKLLLQIYAEEHGGFGESTNDFTGLHFAE